MSMSEMEAIRILENFKNGHLERDKLERDNRCGGWKIGDIYKHLELNEAIETLISELEKKNKIIDLMSDMLVRVHSENKQVEFIANANIKEKKALIIQYFEKKVEEV